MISKTVDKLNDCKGKTLATITATTRDSSTAWYLPGAAKLDDFTLIPTQRPLQTIKAVLNGQAVCALIDDAQRDQIDHLADKDGAHTVWESKELPPMPVVAFPDAPRAERETFKEEARCRMRRRRQECVRGNRHRRSHQRRQPRLRSRDRRV